MILLSRRDNLASLQQTIFSEPHYSGSGTGLSCGVAGFQGEVSELNVKVPELPILAV